MEQQHRLNSGMMMPPTSSSYLPPMVMNIKAEETAHPQQSWNVLPSSGPSVPAPVHQTNPAVPYITCIGGVQYYVMPPGSNQAAPAASAAAGGDTSSAAYGHQRNPGSISLPPQTMSAAAAAARQQPATDERRALRLQKNKECARACRQKRKHELNLLKGRVEALEAEKKRLTDRVQYLEAYCSVYHSYSVTVPGANNQRGPTFLQ